MSLLSEPQAPFAFITNLKFESKRFLKVWLIRQSFCFCLLTWRDRPFLSEKLLPPRKRRAVKSGEPYSPKKLASWAFPFCFSMRKLTVSFSSRLPWNRDHLSLSPHLRRDRELHLALCPKNVSNIQSDLFALNISGFISKPLFMFSDLVLGTQKERIAAASWMMFSGLSSQVGGS